MPQYDTKYISISSTTSLLIQWHSPHLFSGGVWAIRSFYFLVSRSGIVPIKVVMTMWQWVAVSIIYNNIYNSGWNEQRRFVTGHGNLTICLAAKSGNQRSAISHNPVAHKWLWTRCSYPYIRGSGFRFKPGSQLCRLSCRVPLIVFWLATVIIMV